MALSDLQTALSNIQAALAADTTSPQQNYSLGGQAVNQATWRASMIKQSQDLAMQINAQAPYVIVTRHTM